jgi:N-acetylneuraminic acid mutarotase
MNTMRVHGKKTFWVWMALAVLCAGCAKKDPTPPRVSFTAPLVPASGILLRDVKFQVNASAAGEKTIRKVVFRMDGVELPNGTITAPPYEYRWVEKDKFGVTRKITATAYDNEDIDASASLELKFFDAVEKAPMPTSRYAFTTGVVNGRIYVIGGFDRSPSLVEEYDPAANAWATKHPSKFPHSAGAACVVGDLIYVFGGGSAGEWVTNVEAYDPRSDTWTDKAPIPQEAGAAVAMSTCAVGADGKLYLMGGLAAQEPSLVAQYDPLSDSWKMTGAVKLEYSGAALTLNGPVYFIGGCEFKSIGICPNPVRALQTYDPASGAWAVHAPMLTPRADFCAAAAGGKIYVMGGGATSPLLPLLAQMEAYDPQSDRWSALPDMPEGLANFGCAAVGGKIYIIGQQHVYEYNPD